MKSVLGVVYSIFQRKNHEAENLNGIRALAILAVVVYHTWVTVKTSYTWLPDSLKLFLGSLSTGVDFFFLLSGFLIYGGLRREFEATGNIRIKNFFIKRSLRIFPAYYFALSVLYFSKRAMLAKWDSLPVKDPSSIALFESARIALSNVWVDIFYLSDILHVPVVYNGGWSLSIEEHFYLLLPFLCVLFFFKLSLSERLWIYIFGFISALGLRYYFSWPEPNEKAVYMLYCRFDSIMYGMFVYEMYHHYPISLSSKSKIGWKRRIGLAASFVLVCISHQIESSSAFAIVYRPTIVSIGFGLLMYFSFFQIQIRDFFSLPLWRPFARLGYTAYLWHLFAIPMAAKSIMVSIQKDPSLTNLIIAIFLVLFYTFLLSWIFYLLVEYPFLRWKERLVQPEKIL